jgi:hypothetical protein
MNREQAEAQRDRMAVEHPDSTWLIAEQASGEWDVVKVGLKPSEGPSGTATEARPKPDYPDDPRDKQNNLPYPWSI